jgi:hypothetical protein
MKTIRTQDKFKGSKTEIRELPQKEKIVAALLYALGLSQREILENLKKANLQKTYNKEGFNFMNFYEKGVPVYNESYTKVATLLLGSMCSMFSDQNIRLLSSVIFTNLYKQTMLGSGDEDRFVKECRSIFAMDMIKYNDVFLF